jgi:peptidoglycan/xylan/chitin deacetylase (PgdA/CDA1 family)
MQLVDMQQTRIPYQLTDERTPLKGPGGKQLIVHIVVNVEVWPFDQPMPRGILTPPHGQAAVPDLPNWGWAEYGLRAGMPRFFRVLSGLPVSCAINSAIIDVYPRLAERIVEAGWEWVGHGVIQRSVKSVPDERAMIEEAKAAIERYTSKKMRGWLGPGLQETFDTPDILKALGFDYLCEWCVDDTPSWMETRHGRIVSVPYCFETNDSVIYAVEKHSSDEMTSRLERTLECFIKERSEGPRIFTIPLHPHLMGVPHRIGFLERFLDTLVKRKDTVFMTGAQIADWFAATTAAGSRKAKKTAGAPVKK